jgi:hypothetical protein
MTDYDCRRLAVQIVAQLPADPHDAKRVLDHARVFIDKFLSGTEPESAKVVSLNPLITD